MAKWYIRRGEKLAGPVESSKLELLVPSRGLLPTDELAQDVAGPWYLAGDTTLFPEPEPGATESAQAPTQGNPTVNKPPIRIRGWLLVFCVILTIIGPVVFVASFVLSLILLALVGFDALASLSIGTIGSALGSAALIIYGLLVGYKIWQGHPQGRQIAKRFLLI